MVPTSARIAALAAMLAASWLPAGAQTGGGIEFGPRLLYYPLVCHDRRACRIDCYQSGVKVASRRAIAEDEDVRIVVGAGIADELVPRWIEFRSKSSGDVQTILLTRDTMCDLQSLSIEPLGSQ